MALRRSQTKAGSRISNLWRPSTAHHRRDRTRNEAELLTVQGIGAGIVKKYGSHIFPSDCGCIRFDLWRKSFKLRSQACHESSERHLISNVCCTLASTPELFSLQNYCFKRAHNMSGVYSK